METTVERVVVAALIAGFAYWMVCFILSIGG